jgi:hypothetical protein
MVKNMRGFWLAVGVLLIVALAAPAAMATCIPAKLAGQDPGGGPGTRGYIYFGPYFVPYGESSPYGGYPNVGGWVNDADLHAGKFWQPGNRAGANEGTTPIDGWLKGWPQSYYKHWIGINLGDGTVVGCPSQNLIYIVEDQIDDDDNDTSTVGDGFAENARFVIGRAPETPARPYSFDTGIGNGYAQQVAADHPRPKVQTSSKLGNVITATLAYDDPAAGFYGGAALAPGSITGIRLYQACGTDPGRAASSWTHVATVPYDGGSESHIVSVDCSTGLVNGGGTACPNDEVLLAGGLALIDGVNSSYVSRATVIECDPNLAEPGRPSRPRPGGPAIDRPRRPLIDR